MQGINQVLQRMNTIQQRFQGSTRATENFSKVLASEQASGSNAMGSNAIIEKNFASGDIGKIIEFTAKKYGVDPKLAMAVAKVESNLQPDVVS